MEETNKYQPKYNNIVIKRYQNRKLYDTFNSTYVTLEDIGNLVRHGQEVRIIDNKSKEDLTSVTLTQIIFEEEKKKKNQLPLAILKNIIRGSAEDLFEFLRTNPVSSKPGFHATLPSGIQKIVVGKNSDFPTDQGDLYEEIRKLRQRIHYLEKKLMVYEKRPRV